MCAARREAGRVKGFQNPERWVEDAEMQRKEYVCGDQRLPFQLYIIVAMRRTSNVPKTILLARKTMAPMRTMRNAVVGVR